MFYRTIKDFWIKKHINKSLGLGLHAVNNDSIKTIGLLIDGINFTDKEKLINEFKKHANGQFKINLLVYRKKAKKEESIEYPYFTKYDVGYDASLRKGEIENFVNFQFDLLVSYYDKKNPNLELVTAKSKANFKVGFATINKDLNHFFINTYVEQYVDFTKILFDYLKILKKI